MSPMLESPFSRVQDNSLTLLSAVLEVTADRQTVFTLRGHSHAQVTSKHLAALGSILKPDFIHF